MDMINGYVFLDLTKSNVYAKALKVLGADKPVVIKDGVGSPYFVDSIALDGTNVVITKGGKTITIANDNTITNVGDIQNHLYEYGIYCSGSDIDTSFTLHLLSSKIFENNASINFDTLMDLIYIGVLAQIGEFSDTEKINGNIYTISTNSFDVVIPKGDGTDYDMNISESDLDIGITINLAKQLF